MDSKRVLRTEYDFKGLNRDDRSIYYYREDGTVEQRIGGDRACGTTIGQYQVERRSEVSWNYADAAWGCGDRRR